MKQKQKEKKKFFTRKRVVFSLVFLCFALSFLVYSLNIPKAEGAESYDYLFNSFSGTQDVSTAAKAPSVPSGFGGMIMSGVLWVFNILLLAVFRIMMVLLIIAGLLFDWAINAENFLAIMRLSSIQEGWRMVRDLFNIFFILVLLFSAFCTIFQVEKYNIKKILLTLVIMALLVNFSFPIARFVIDAANIPAYYFFQTLANSIGSNSLSQGIINSFSMNAPITGMSESGAAGLQNAILPSSLFSKGYGNSDLTFSLIAAIIFVFLFGVTLLIIAVLFIIRILMLAILVIFSPVGFVAAILPSFSKYADSWWTQLFKQSFFAPIMAFMLYMSVFMMIGMQGEIARGINNKIQSNIINGNGPASTAIVNGISLAIPIVLLWVAIIVSQQMGAHGAKFASGKAQNLAKWAGRLPWRGVKAGANATGIPGGIKQKYENVKSGFKSKQAQREANIAGKGPFAVKGAQMQDINKRSEEYKKNHVSEDELKSKARKGDVAAAHRLAADGNMDVDTYEAVMPVIKDQKVKDMLDGKVKEKRVDVIMDYKIKTETEDRAKIIAGSSPVTDSHRNQAKIDIVQEEMGKVAPSKWREQNADELLGFNKDGSKKMDTNSKVRRIAVRRTFKNMSRKNQEKAVDDMEPGKYAKGKKAGAWA